jgi:hypothetical protein
MRPEIELKFIARNFLRACKKYNVDYKEILRQAQVEERKKALEKALREGKLKN